MATKPDPNFTEVYRDCTIRVASDGWNYVVAEISPYQKHATLDLARKAIRDHRAAARVKTPQTSRQAVAQ